MSTLLTARKCACWRGYTCLNCENDALRQAGVKIERKVAQCGTRAGYNRHLKQGEPTCAECKQAQLEAVLRWKANRSTSEA